VIPGELAHLSHRHQFDESNMPVVLESESRKIADLVVVDPAHHDDVDFYRR
jgi:hypothetical protein